MVYGRLSKTTPIKIFTQTSHIKIFRSLHGIYVQPIRLPEIATNCCLIRSQNVLYNDDSTTPHPT